jgi:hypothetical protein
MSFFGNNHKLFYGLGLTFIVIGILMSIVNMSVGHQWRYGAYYSSTDTPDYFVTISDMTLNDYAMQLRRDTATSTVYVPVDVMECRAISDASKKSKDFCMAALETAAPALKGLSIFAILLYLPYLSMCISAFTSGTPMRMLPKMITAGLGIAGWFFYMVAIAAYGGKMPNESMFKDMVKEVIQPSAKYDVMIGPGSGFGLAIGAFFFLLFGTIHSLLAVFVQPSEDKHSEQYRNFDNQGNATRGNAGADNAGYVPQPAQAGSAYGAYVPPSSASTTSV